MIEEVMDTHFEAINWGLGELAGSAAPRASSPRRSAPTPSRRPKASSPGSSAQLGERPGSTARASAGATSRWSPTSTARRRLSAIRPPKGSKLSAWLGRANARPRSPRRSRRHAQLQHRGMTDVAELVDAGPVQARIPRPPPGVDDQVRRPRRGAEGPGERQHPLHARARPLEILHRRGRGTARRVVEGGRGRPRPFQDRPRSCLRPAAPAARPLHHASHGPPPPTGEELSRKAPALRSAAPAGPRSAATAEAMS